MEQILCRIDWQANEERSCVVIAAKLADGTVLYSAEYPAHFYTSEGFERAEKAYKDVYEWTRQHGYTVNNLLVPEVV